MGHMSASRKRLFLHLPVTPTEPLSPAFQDLSLAGCLQKLLAAPQGKDPGSKSSIGLLVERHVAICNTGGISIMAADAKPWLHPRSRRFMVATYLKHQNLLLAPGFCWHHFRDGKVPTIFSCDEHFFSFSDSL